MRDEYSDPQHPDHLLNSEVTFEVADIRAGSIVGLGIALLGTLFVSMFIVWITFRVMDARQRADEPIISPLRVGMAPELPPEPRLQGEPGHPMLGPQELRDVLSQARMQLDSSGWVNEPAGITHIPIQQAMDDIVQNGLPQVHPSAAAKAVAAASASGAKKEPQPDSSLAGKRRKAIQCRWGRKPTMTGQCRRRNLPKCVGGKRGLLFGMALSMAVLLAAISGSPARAQDLLSPAPTSSQGLPPQFQDIGFKPPLNGALPLDGQFRDENGQTVHLGDYFYGKPVVLALVYYKCPLLCNQSLQGLVGSLTMVNLNPGQDFEVVVVSFDPRETPAMALAKKQDVLAHYRRGETGWHFLTGDQLEIRRLTDAAGFRFVWDAPSKMWAHASGLLVITPEGRISRYFYGLEYSPRDLRWGLIEASHNKIGTPVDQVLLFCYHYDPTTGKYGALVVRMLRVGGGLTLLGLGLLVYVCIRRARRADRLRHIENLGTIGAR